MNVRTHKRYDHVERVRILDRKTLGDGSERRDAYLTRAGIFVYSFDPDDGQGFREIRELRPESEVFDKASLDSLRAVTVVEGHPAHIDSENWHTYAKGHVGDDVRRADDGSHFVQASLIIKDKTTLDALDRGELGELSCGYTVDLDWTPGETEDGQHYDAIQRNIRYNHVGIGDASGWGRAGHDVRIRDAYAEDMSKTDNRVINDQARTDAPAGPLGTQNTNNDAENARLRQDLDSARGERDAIRVERDNARADATKEKDRADKLQGELDATKTKLEQATQTDAQIDARVEARCSLIDSARPVLGGDFVFKGKTERDIRIAVLTKHDRKFDANGKSDAYLEGRFDSVIGEVRQDKANLNELATNANADTTNADGENDMVGKAQREMQERNANAWKPKPAATSAAASK